jgi:hypothetical protein
MATFSSYIQLPEGLSGLDEKSSFGGVWYFDARGREFMSYARSNLGRAFGTILDQTRDAVPGLRRSIFMIVEGLSYLKTLDCEFAQVSSRSPCTARQEKHVY